MPKYEVDISKTLMKTVTVEAPDHVSLEDAREFAWDAADDLFDLEEYEKAVEWDEDEFYETPTKLIVQCTIDEGHEYSIDGVTEVVERKAGGQVDAS